MAQRERAMRAMKRGAIISKTKKLFKMMEAPKTISKFAFSCEPVWSMYRAQTGFYQAHRETSNEAQLALIKVFLLYMVQTGSHEKVKLEPVLGA